MLCSKFKQIVLTKSTIKHNVQFRCFITSRFVFKKWVWVDGFLAGVGKNGMGRMSTLRFILRDFRVWSAWTRSNLINIVVKKCRRDRSVREVIQSFRQTFFRPRRIGLISAIAAFEAKDHDREVPDRCAKNITDEELKALISDLEGVESLSKRTLFCVVCNKRLVIDKKQNGVDYCTCKEPKPPAESPDGWVPFLEAEDVIIWRKEYKPGAALYAYKVYGRYNEVKAADFAAIQVDGAYRRVWDTAVAALAVVERTANGLPDQAVLHWEVLWPRLFANRDYVYIRRHKEFDVTFKGDKDLFRKPVKPDTRTNYPERESVHSKAKRKSMEAERRKSEREQSRSTENKAYVIISRSCIHPKVPETKHAIRVIEYWSHMVVRTVNGPDKAGMEFVLTYYDEPAVGGMPSGVAAWASGRAAPAYLQRMRAAAMSYQQWASTHHKDLPDFEPFSKYIEPEEDDEDDEEEEEEQQEQKDGEAGEGVEAGGEGVEAGKEGEKDEPVDTVQEDIIEIPELEPVFETTDEPEPPEAEDPDSPLETPDNEEEQETKSQSTQTEGETPVPVLVKHDVKSTDTSDIPVSSKENDPEKEEEENKNGGSWWRYLHPYYYFV